MVINLKGFINIGNVKVEKTAALAPMASVGDRAYRYMCKKFGASYLVTEMVSSKGIFYNDKKSTTFLENTEYEQPIAVQLFGDEPEVMAFAAKKAVEYGAKIIDVNMGCPVPKVAGNGSGSYLLKTPTLASEIIKEMTKAVDVPVTVKIRKGWDDTSVNAVEFALLMQESGASAVAIHGRTRAQMYRPSVDLDIIKSVKQAVTIPVIGNGDIHDIESAVNMYEKTGCDLIMIGRATYGRPWIFSQISHYFKTGELLPEPNIEERLNIMQDHVRLICEFKGEHIGMREARKQVAFYLKGVKDAAKYRNVSGQLNTYSDFLKLKDNVLNSCVGCIK